jgi:hypothetical protein
MPSSGPGKIRVPERSALVPWYGLSSRIVPKRPFVSGRTTSTYMFTPSFIGTMKLSRTVLYFGCERPFSFV